jgi:hypothetical protein
MTASLINLDALSDDSGSELSWGGPKNQLAVQKLDAQ